MTLMPSLPMNAGAGGPAAANAAAVGSRRAAPPALPAIPGNALGSGCFDRLLQRLRQTSDAFEARLAALPQRQPCGMHPRETAALHVEKSYKAGEPVYDCPACAAERRARRDLRRAEAAGIPADVRHATLENFDFHRPHVNPAFTSPARFLEAARNIANGGTRNGIFSGTPGIGKGHLAAAICQHFLAQGRDVAWTECATLFNAWHRAYASDSTEQVLLRHARPALLVLDEICLRDMPKDGEEILFAILDARHKARRQTLLLSNQPGPVIKDWLGARLYDRLKSGGCFCCYGEWESMRGTDGDGAECAF